MRLLSARGKSKTGRPVKIFTNIYIRLDGTANRVGEGSDNNIEKCLNFTNILVDSNGKKVRRHLVR